MFCSEVVHIVFLFKYAGYVSGRFIIASPTRPGDPFTKGGPLSVPLSHQTMNSQLGLGLH